MPVRFVSFQPRAFLDQQGSTQGEGRMRTHHRGSRSAKWIKVGEPCADASPTSAARPRHHPGHLHLWVVSGLDADGASPPAVGDIWAVCAQKFLRLSIRRCGPQVLQACWQALALCKCVAEFRDPSARAPGQRRRGMFRGPISQVAVG